MAVILCDIHGRQPGELVCSHIGMQLDGIPHRLFQFTCVAADGSSHSEVMCEACAALVGDVPIPGEVEDEDTLWAVIEQLEPLIPHQVVCRKCYAGMRNRAPEPVPVPVSGVGR